MNYRPLNEGEMIQEGDELWYNDTLGWQESLCLGQTIEQARPSRPKIYRRPIASEWDTDSGTEANRKGWSCNLERFRQAISMLCAGTPLKPTAGLNLPTGAASQSSPQEPDPFDEWAKTQGFKDAWNPGEEIIRRDVGRKIFNAGRDYEKNK